MSQHTFYSFEKFAYGLKNANIMLCISHIIFAAVTKPLEAILFPTLQFWRMPALYLTIL